MIKNNETHTTSRADLSLLIGRNGDIFLPNREYFFNVAGQQFNEHRQRLSFLLAYIDLRSFKQVNDEIGHAAGNDALDEYYKRLCGMFRVDDEQTAVVAREGGDEFLLLAHHAFVDQGDRFSAIESIHSRILATGFNFEGVDISARTAIVASYPENPVPTIQELFLQADDALVRVRRVEKTGTKLHPLQGMFEV